MRSLKLVVALMVVAGLVLALTPTGSARPSPVCVEGKWNCPGVVCVDRNLDGKWQTWNECVEFYCVGGCCYGRPCPPPYE